MRTVLDRTEQRRNGYPIVFKVSMSCSGYRLCDLLQWNVLQEIQIYRRQAAATLNGRQAAVTLNGRQAAVTLNGRQAAVTSHSLVKCLAITRCRILFSSEFITARFITAEVYNRPGL